MKQFLGVVAFLTLLAVYMVLNHVVSKKVADTFRVSRKMVSTVIGIIVFLICSYLALYTKVYQRFSELTETPLKQR
jgi:hypothetical protein